MGAGGIGLIAHAAGSATPSSFVSITPCRLFDTRPATVVGDRSTPLAAGEEFVRPVWGTNGSCTIPSTATGISYNLTVPTSINGFLTVYPADAGRPNSSSINPVAGEGVKANGGIVGLSAAGAIKVFTLTGPVDALLDITGYFVPSSATPSVAATGTIPSNQTVTGSIVYDTHQGAAATTDSDAVGVDLPGIAPVALTDATINFGAAEGTGDDDPSCTGTSLAPTAPAGKVCVYLAGNNIDLSTIAGFQADLATRSFVVGFAPDPAGVAEADEFLFASWAYTAP